MIKRVSLKQYFCLGRGEGKHSPLYKTASFIHAQSFEKRFLLTAVFSIFIGGFIGEGVHAQTLEGLTVEQKPSDLPALKKTGQVGQETGLPLPRFLALSKQKVYLRAGPGKKYPILYIYHRKGLPVEVLNEYENWREIRDWEGERGWIYGTLLSGYRHARIMRQGAEVYQKADMKSFLRARLDAGVIVRIEHCTGLWCEIKVEGVKGFIEQTKETLYGVYPNETFE